MKIHRKQQLGYIGLDFVLDVLVQGLVTVPFWEYWTSPYSSHGIDHIPGWVMFNGFQWGHLMTHCLILSTLLTFSGPSESEAMATVQHLAETSHSALQCHSNLVRNW